MSENTNAGGGEPTAELLRSYGYAPGGYMVKCIDCRTQHWDLDKRAIRCKACATIAARRAPAVRAALSAQSTGSAGVAAEPVAWLNERIVAAERDRDAHIEGTVTEAFYSGQIAAYENALGFLTRLAAAPTPPTGGGETERLFSQSLADHPIITETLRAAAPSPASPAGDLISLSAGATPGPWAVRQLLSDKGAAYEECFITDERSNLATDVDRAEAEFIVALVNAFREGRLVEAAPAAPRKGPSEDTPTASIVALRGDNSDYVVLAVEPKGEPVRRMRISKGGADVLIAELSGALASPPPPAGAAGGEKTFTPKIETCPKRGAQGAAFICSEPGCPVNGGAAYPWTQTAGAAGGGSGDLAALSAGAEEPGRWDDAVLMGSPGNRKLASALVNAYRSGRLIEAPTPDLGAQGDQTQAARDVLAERRRQIEAEGWTPEHDDKHNRCELATAAAGYATAPSPVSIEREWVYPDPPRNWPWHRSWWKPRGYRENLVRAGSLIIAEIERWDRLANKDTGDTL